MLAVHPRDDPSNPVTGVFSTDLRIGLTPSAGSIAILLRLMERSCDR